MLWVSIEKHRTMVRVCCNNARHVFVLLSLLVATWGWERCEGSGKFRFDVHHVFSDPVKHILGVDDLLPEKHSLEYFKVLAHRDLFFRGRGLASNNDQTPVTFLRGNTTLELDPLGFLHYANVSVGTPAKWFLVALDTGSNLFWLPCDCGGTCAKDLKDLLGLQRSLPLNVYSPNTSSTSRAIHCSDKQCFQVDQCPLATSECPYQIQYLSNNTSSTGALFEDLLHLVTEDESLRPVEANITLGCGRVQTGQFRERGAVNGLFGLGLKDYSVPSVLAKAGIAANSFSMCFGDSADIVGRISFGDKGSSDQRETPLIPVAQSSIYVVNVTGIEVGGNATGVGLFAVFDSGTSFTTLLEPAYGAVTRAFDALVTDKRRPAEPNFPLEFCYEVSRNTTIIKYPRIDLTMRGGSVLTLKSPLFMANLEGGGAIYCLAVVKSNGLNVSIIGQNFMAGYRVVFDRERMVLGWKGSDCFASDSRTSLAPPPVESAAPSPPPRVTQAPPPLPPRVTQAPRPVAKTSDVAASAGFSLRMNPLASPLLLLLSILAFL